YSTTRCATGATCSVAGGWPTRSGIFGFDSGAGVSFGASTTGVDDLNRPLTVVRADLPHRIAAPARIRRMPIAIAVLNGNPPPVRTGLASRSGASRERGPPG